MSGREVAFAELNTGDYFGELSAIDGEPRSASAVAEDDCVVGTLSAKQFNNLLNAHPELMAFLLRRLAKMIRLNNERVMDLSTQSATHRVYRELIKIASENRPTSGVTDDWSISPMPTQKIIAARTSTTRVTVARAMMPLFKSGIIERRGKTVYVHDFDRLDALASALELDSDDNLRWR